MQLFYSPHIEENASVFTFSDDESRHIVRVLRKKQGDTLHITNGKGLIFEAEITEAHSKKCGVQIIASSKTHKKRHWLHLAVAPTKSNDRFEWFLEKATEIGISEITPIICERSERKTVKYERLEKVVQSAMKQSLRSYLPRLNDAISLQQFLEHERKGLLFVAHCGDRERVDLKRRIAPDHDVTVLIGPEGDFSEMEIKAAQQKGYLAASLGDARLRTETAAIVACMTINIINDH